MTRRKKAGATMSIAQELADLRIDRYSSPIARIRVGRIVRSRGAAAPLDEARELDHARQEEAAYQCLNGVTR
jgi:hypothetical protein